MWAREVPCRRTLKCHVLRRSVAYTDLLNPFKEDRRSSVKRHEGFELAPRRTSRARATLHDSMLPGHSASGICNSAKATKGKPFAS